ncbi:MAG: hypothetical protein KAT28_04785 [Candidatus Aenigmarchaeota archaeon]|nr:hypothetical protein [Candidatus Aenigmarchaeota archaeon]
MGLHNKISVVFLMGLVIAMSGCTLDSGGESIIAAGTQGVYIEYFGPDVEYPISDQDITLETRLRNVGGAEASNIDSTLYLLSWDTINSQNACASGLKPPNAEIGRDGEECKVTDDTTTPEVTETQTYNVGVHIDYDYTTTTVATVYAFSENEYAKLKERGETIPTVKDIKNSAAPIQIEVRVPNVLKTDDPVPVTLIFRNVGDGNVRYDDQHYIIDTAEVRINGEYLDTCRDIRMKGGRERSCTVQMDIPAGEEVKLPIKIITSYTYVISAETKIVVHPPLT